MLRVTDLTTANGQTISFEVPEGICQFEFGTARLVADAAKLAVSINLSDAGKLAQAHMVIDKHLERFAFREGFSSMEWTMQP